MAGRPEHNPYLSETARQRAIKKRPVIVVGLLTGAVFGLVLRRHMGWGDRRLAHLKSRVLILMVSMCRSGT